MRRNDDISDSTRQASGESREIEERFLDNGDQDPRSMEAAADDAFVADQRRNPDHPSRRQRELDEEHGIENPSHSQGI
jgi:hypothetical protein